MNRGPVAQIREQYKPGTKVRFVFTDDPYCTLRAGEQGTVESVDDMGTVHIRWQSGSGLGMIPGTDEFDIVTDETDGTDETTTED